MRSNSEEAFTLSLSDEAAVSAIWNTAADARAAFVFAHGAGAGMRHAFMETIAERLAAQGVSTLRFQFPYMEAGHKRPDPPRVAHATIRAAVTAANARAGDLPVFAGGKSFGGRMTSQAQAEQPLTAVRGLILFGFPLHPAGQPDTRRADHLDQVRVPLLFLHGERDKLADPANLDRVIARLGPLTTLRRFPYADHGFHVPVRSGQTDQQICATLAQEVRNWIDRVVS